MSSDPVGTSTKLLANDEVLHALTAERLALCDRLSRVSPPDWSAVSLCDTWTVQEVAAHLALGTRETKWDFVRGLVRHRGNFDRMTAENAARHASRHTPDEIVDQLRTTAESTHITLGSSLRDCLIDVIVHGQDIARPLHLEWATPAERAVIALDHAVSSRWYGARQRFADVALTASDTDWSKGSGTSTVEGPAIDLLMVATGRPAGLDRLHGPGLRVLRERFAG